MRNRSLPIASTIALAICILAVCGAATRAAAQQESVLSEFNQNGAGGTAPYGGLILDKSGNLFGTTSYGGNGNCSTINTTGCGTVFELSPTSGGGFSRKILHVFQNDGHDGNNPASALTLDAAGNLYGTTIYGGSGVCSTTAPTGCGTVFELSRSGNGGWAERILHSFGPGKDGPYPGGGVVFDKAGNLYGVTEGIQSSCYLGSHTNCGAVYQLSPTTTGPWKESVLHYFSFGLKDGYAPAGKLLIDAEGNLIGSTPQGGTLFNGIAYKLVHGENGGWTERVLYNFYWGKQVNGGPAGFVRDAQGVLYSTEPNGGDFGWGSAFALYPSPSGAWTLVTLHSFSVNGTLLDGGTPNPDLIVDPTDGSLIGTTQFGGNGQDQCLFWGGGNESTSCGIVYRLNLVGNGSWNETILHNFGNGTDGWTPHAGVVRDHAGNLFGTTPLNGFDGGGLVYEITP